MPDYYEEQSIEWHLNQPQQPHVKRLLESPMNVEGKTVAEVIEELLRLSGMTLEVRPAVRLREVPAPLGEDERAFDCCRGCGYTLMGCACEDGPY
jgi:hypothetical protein